jgi:hypothetical protein
MTFDELTELFRRQIQSLDGKDVRHLWISEDEKATLNLGEMQRDREAKRWNSSMDRRRLRGALRPLACKLFLVSYFAALSGAAFSLAAVQCLNMTSPILR